MDRVRFVREWGGAVAALLAALFLVLFGGTSADASVIGGGPPGSSPTVTRYEAETYPGTVGSNNTGLGDCSNEGTRGVGLTTGPGVSIPLTIPDDATLVAAVAHARSSGTREVVFAWDGSSPETINVTDSGTTGCSTMTTTSAYVPFATVTGEHTLTLTATAGTGALAIDYVEVEVWTPDPTTTTTESTTTTTESTTTTTAPTTTTTAEPPPFDPAAAETTEGRMALVFSVALTGGLLSGRALFGGRR